jgi:hypothetical protein
LLRAKGGVFEFFDFRTASTTDRSPSTAHPTINPA